MLMFLMALSLIDVMLFPHLEEYPDDTKVQFPVYTVYVCQVVAVICSSSAFLYTVQH